MQIQQFTSKGFTITEAVISLTVGMTILAIAAPAFTSLRASTYITTTTNTLISHINLARSNAIKLGMNVILCPSSDGKDCNTDFSEWGKGYIVFVDMNKNRKHDSVEALLAVQQSFDPLLTITTSSRFRRLITYHPSGMSAGSNTTFRICLSNHTAANKVIIISNTGRPRSSDRMPGNSEISCST